MKYILKVVAISALVAGNFDATQAMQRPFPKNQQKQHMLVRSSDNQFIAPLCKKNQQKQFNSEQFGKNQQSDNSQTKEESQSVKNSLDYSIKEGSFDLSDWFLSQEIPSDEGWLYDSLPDEFVPYSFLPDNNSQNENDLPQADSQAMESETFENSSNYFKGKTPYWEYQDDYFLTPELWLDKNLSNFVELYENYSSPLPGDAEFSNSSDEYFFDTIYSNN